METLETPEVGLIGAEGKLLKLENVEAEEVSSKLEVNVGEFELEVVVVCCKFGMDVVVFKLEVVDEGKEFKVVVDGVVVVVVVVKEEEEEVTEIEVEVLPPSLLRSSSSLF